MALRDRASILRIVICLLRLDLWAAETITDGWLPAQRLPEIEHHFQSRWENPPSPEVIDIWLQSTRLYQSQPMPALREYLDRMTDEQLIAAIMNPSAEMFYRRLLQRQISRLLEQKTIHSFAAQHLQQAFQESQGLLISQRPATSGEYLVKLRLELSESQRRLKAVIREARILRDNIAEAYPAGDLDDSALELLKSKLEALNEYYHEACQELDGEVVPEMLMNPRRIEFWNTNPQTPPPQAAVSYPVTSDLESLIALNILVLSLFMRDFHKWRGPEHGR